MSKEIRVTIDKGTIVHMNGIPVVLSEPMSVLTTEANISLLFDTPAEQGRAWREVSARMQ